MFHSVTCKLGNMKKAQEWTIYKREENSPEVMIQCDKRIAKINVETRQAMLSTKGSSFMHLLEFMGAIKIEVPQDTIDKILAAGSPKVGEYLGGGIIQG